MKAFSGEKQYIKNILVRDKIYFKKEDVVEDFEHFKSKFIHKQVNDYYSTLIEYNDGVCSLPSNGWWMLKWDNLIDERNYPHRDKLTFNATLRDYQKDAPPQFLETKNGIARSGLLQAQCSWGKTFVGTYLITQVQTKTLVMVHTKLLFRQWEEELYKQTNVTKVGLVGDGIFDPQDITIGIYKSVSNNAKELQDKFGFILVDEAHRCPAKTFSEALNNLNARIKSGMTATPFRLDGKHGLLPEYFTPFKVIGKEPPRVNTVYYNIHETPYDFTYLDPKRDRARALSKLASNLNYIEYIASLAVQDIRSNRCILILSERLEMLKLLNKIIPKSILLVGGTDEDKRSEILNNAGIKYDVILSTTLFDEGISCHRIDTIYLTCPTSNLYKQEQRIGRIIREHPDKQEPLVRDFWLKGSKIKGQQEKRLNWYVKQGFKKWNQKILL